MKNNKNLHKVNDSFNKIENSKFINRWIYAPGPTEAFQISIVSAIVTVIAFIAGLSISISTHSSATLGYSLENLVDLVSSLIVLWRFHGGDTANKEELQKREKRASIGIALLMVILAICVFSVAVEHLAEGHAPSALHQLISLSVPSLLIFLILGILKFNIAIKTQSPAMKKDAVCSLGGAILSLGVLIGVGLFQSDDAIWWFDAFVAIIISILLGLYGVRTLVKNILEDKKYWTMKFWMEGKVYKNVDEQNLKGTDDGISAGDIELGGDNLQGGIILQDILPSWAYNTLGKHTVDERPKIYTLDELKEYKTNDLLWNLCQQSLVETGELHNNLRMPWGKQLLIWTETAEDAYEYMLYLNDHFALDGMAPPSYHGIGWCLGLYDSPKNESKIFGRVRYKSTTSKSKYLNVGKYKQQILMRSSNHGKRKFIGMFFNNNNKSNENSGNSGSSNSSDDGDNHTTNNNNVRLKKRKKQDITSFFNQR